MTNHLRLGFADAHQHMLWEGQLGLGHAGLGWLGWNDVVQQVALAEKAVAEGASVREFESWVKAVKSPGTASVSPKRAAGRPGRRDLGLGPTG